MATDPNDQSRREPGRPPLPAERRLSRTIRVRVTPPDYRRIRSLADAEGLSVSEWARRALEAAT